MWLTLVDHSEPPVAHLYMMEELSVMQAAEPLMDRRAGGADAAAAEAEAEAEAVFGPEPLPAPKVGTGQIHHGGGLHPLSHSRKL